MDYEQITAELEGGGEPQTPEPVATPEPAAPDPAFDYYLGDKANQLPQSAEFAIKHNGQLQRVPATKLVNNYRQTAHLESKLKELSDKYGQYEQKVGPLDEWEKKQQELSKFEALQKWSVENPDQFQQVWSGYERGQNGLPATDDGNPQFEALNRTINQLRSELGEVKEWKSAREKAEEEANIETQMQKIDEEAAEFSEQYKKYGISLDSVDEEGISLRGRILNHAVEEGFKSFKSAAKSYLHDTLLEKAAQMGRQDGVKGMRGDVNAGIVNRTVNPPQGQSPAVDVRKMSEEDRLKSAVAELAAQES